MSRSCYAQRLDITKRRNTLLPEAKTDLLLTLSNSGLLSLRLATHVRWVDEHTKTGLLHATPSPPNDDNDQEKALALDRASHQTTYKEALQREEHDQRQQHRNKRASRQQVPILTARTD
jgi:hypothetical protein